MGVFLRWLFAFLLVAATYNPTQWNYVRWTMAYAQTYLSLTVLMGLLLAIGYMICIRATARSIGGFGMVLVLAVVGALVWVLHDFGLLSLENGAVNTWIAIFSVSMVLGIGLSWSLVRRRLSGQVDTDDVEE